MDRSTMSMLENALDYAARGMNVFPLHSVRPDGSCTCGSSRCRQQGKHPRTKTGHREATTDEAQIKKWWAEGHWPNANIGAVSSRHLCLDVDVKHGSEGPVSLEALISDNAPLPNTAVAQTGLYVDEEGDELRGSHYWFLVPEGERVASAVSVRPGVDLKCGNGYAILPPSAHKSGVEYSWVVDLDEIDAAPAWLLALTNEPVDRESSWSPRESFVMAQEKREFLQGTYDPDAGGQREFLVECARSVLTTGATVEEATKLLWEGHDGTGGISNATQADENWPWTEDDVAFIVEDVFRTSPTSALSKDFDASPVKFAKGKSGEKEKRDEYYNSDWGNARRLVDSYDEGEVIHVAEWDKWYVWDGSSWVEDDGSAQRLRFERVAREMRLEAAKLMNSNREDDGKALMRHANTSQSRPRTEAAVYLGRDLVRTRQDALNADPFLLNVQNGVVDLRTAELLPHSPAYLLTKRSRVDYVPGATSTLWDKVLEDWVPRQDMRDFLQRVFGYALTGTTVEHKFFYFYGPPGSGKSTLLEAFSSLMGNYSETAEPDTFMSARQTGGPTEDLARLAAARVVVTHEVEEGSKFAEAKISHLTGGDSVTARFLHSGSFTFEPKFKLFFTANHLPRVSGSSKSGLWRRLVVVEFDRTIPENERDPMLATRLRTPEVRQAMLAWAVEGARLWMGDYEAGRLMTVPDVVQEAVEEYRTEADHLHEFIASLKNTGDAKDRVAKPDLTAYYKAWCEENGYSRPKSPKSVTQRLREEGFTEGQARFDSKVRDCWHGMKIPLFRGL